MLSGLLRPGPAAPPSPLARPGPAAVNWTTRSDCPPGMAYLVNTEYMFHTPPARFVPSGVWTTFTS